MTQPRTITMTPDEIENSLRCTAIVLSGDRRLRHLNIACSQAILFMAVARHVELDSDRGDPFLIEQLAAAAKELDSALLDAAASRLRCLTIDVRELRSQNEVLRYLAVGTEL
jgi:hypothetical protein